MRIKLESGSRLLEIESDIPLSMATVKRYWDLTENLLPPTLPLGFQASISEERNPSSSMEIPMKVVE